MTYYGPDEPPSTVFLERTFLAADFLGGVGYGGKSRFRQSAFLLFYTTFLIIVQTIFMVVQANTVQSIYIDNRNYPGGPWQYFLATQNLPVDVIFFATLFVLTFLSDILVLWRCWVIWTASGRIAAYVVTAFPTLLLLASFAMGTLWTLQSSQPGLSLYSKLPQAYGMSYYVISLTVNIIITILIIIRLLMYRRTILDVLPKEHARHYVSIATIMVESAALYSVLALIFIITYAVNNPMNQIFLTAASCAQQIASYLIIYRLADGRAWTKNTLDAQQTLPTMNFRSGQVHHTTQLSSFHVSPGPISILTPAHARDMESTLLNTKANDSLTLSGSTS
ncbi:hypothetical protein L208DRAFT_1416769 [Tricholoma matsutake]|nr:hypothetical protein L208DRAFT_1416769 [Tricholoma matsutake 945]